jgi:hypothetical protein
MTLVGLFSIPLMLSFGLILQQGAAAIEFAILSAVLPTFWTLWLASFRLYVDSHSIVYKQPFFRTSTLSWSDVKSVDVTRGHGKRRASVSTPFARIVVTAHRGQKGMAINARPFRFNEARACVAFMRARGNAGQVAANVTNR